MEVVGCELSRLTSSFLAHLEAPPMNARFLLRLIAAAIGSVFTAPLFAAQSLADVTPDEMCVPCVTDVCVEDNAPPSWIFRHSTYSHDPMTGARVAQYMRTPPVEPLDDERNVT